MTTESRNIIFVSAFCIRVAHMKDCILIADIIFKGYCVRPEIHPETPVERR